MATPELTAAQIRHFETFGFVVRPQLFTPAKTAGIVAAFEEVMAEDRSGESFRGDKRHSVVACAERHPAMRALIDDPHDHVVGLRRQLLRGRYLVASRRIT
jgi:hypothetical protein